MGRTFRRTEPPGGDAGVTRLTNLDLEERAVITIDGDRRILSLSRDAERILGCRAVEVLGEPLDRLLPGRFVKGGHGGEEVVGGRRTPAEARRLAMEMNDDVVQGLVVAQSVLALGGDPERVRETVDQTLAGVRRLMTALLGDGPVESGDLVRRGPLDPPPKDPGLEPLAQTNEVHQ